MGCRLRGSAGLGVAALAAFLLLLTGLLASPAWAQATLTEETEVNESGITIEKDDSPDPADVGESLRYTLTVTNDSGKTQDLTVVDEPPDGVDFIGVSSNEADCTESNNVVDCDLDTLGDSDTATIRILVEPQEAGTIENTAQVFARGDPSTSIVEVTESTRVEDGAGPGPDPDDGDDRDRDRDHEEFIDEEFIDEVYIEDERFDGERLDSYEEFDVDERSIDKQRGRVLADTIPNKLLPNTGGGITLVARLVALAVLLSVVVALLVGLAAARRRS